MNRVFNVESGFDCRTECKHERKGEHGISSDTWTYAVIDSDARAALELRVMTPFYPTTVNVKSLPVFLQKFRGANVCMHFGYPINKAQVMDGVRTRICEYIGVCYDAGSWGLMGDELVDAHFNQEQGLQQGPIGPVVLPHILKEQPALWAALEERLAELVKQRQAERASDGDLRWRVCEHCVGQGVVGFDKPRSGA